MFGWYGLGRLFIEGLRTDSLYLGSTNIRLSQLVALICIVLSVFALVWGTVRAKAAGVTTLYTKTENGKWMMTDALCAEESTEEAEETGAEEEESEADEEYVSDEDDEAELTDENEDEDISEEAENEEINDTETEETEKKEDGDNN